MKISPKAGKISLQELKERARALHKTCKEAGKSAKYSHCLEEISRQIGYKCYSAALAALMDKPRHEKAKRREIQTNKIILIPGNHDRYDPYQKIVSKTRDSIAFSAGGIRAQLFRGLLGPSGGLFFEKEISYPNIALH